MMINELKNSQKSRNELRSKHLAQLEESKANLTELKTKATQQLNPSSSVDQEIPSEDGPENGGRSKSGKRDAKSPNRVRTAEILLNRVASTRSNKSE